MRIEDIKTEKDLIDYIKEYEDVIYVRAFNPIIKKFCATPMKDLSTIDYFYFRDQFVRAFLEFGAVPIRLKRLEEIEEKDA